jgi:hypothetical protein
MEVEGTEFWFKPNGKFGNGSPIGVAIFESEGNEIKFV